MKKVLKKLIFKIRLFFAFIQSKFDLCRAKGKPKIFIVGRNKTGTTSMKKAFEDLGFVVGEKLVSDYLTDKYFLTGNYSKLIRFIDTAEVFQDVPFSLCEFLPVLDKNFPGSKFILTVRDNELQWYNSLVKFHSKRYGKNGDIPSFSDLESQEKYAGSGFLINVMRVHGTPKNNPYSKDIMCAHYNRHNEYVVEYFKRRPGVLLVVNLSDQGAYKSFLEFIGVDSDFKSFPWENQT
jgi:hypothetical protein